MSRGLAEDPATGVVDAPEPQEITSLKTAKPVPYFKLYREADARDKLLMVLGTIGAGANGAAMPLFSVVFGNIINDFGNNADDAAKLQSTVNKTVLLFVYIAIGSFVASYLEVAFWMLSGARQANRYREKYLRAVLRQEVAFFDVTATTGILLQGLNDDSTAIQNAIAEKVGNTVHHLCTFAVGIAIAFWRGWSMTLVLLAITPLLMLAGISIALVMGKMSGRSSEAYGHANSIVQQAVSNIRTVTAFNGQIKILEEYRHALALPVKEGIKSALIQGLAIGFTNLVFLCSYGLALFYGSQQIVAGRYNGGDVVNVLFAALIGGFSLGQAAPNLQYFVAGKASGARIMAVMDRRPLIDEEPGALRPDQAGVEGHIELRHIGFSYPARPTVPVLSDFSLDVPAGKTVALVGESGSGKSTIVSLVERFYDPQEGQVLLDGTDIRTLSLHWLRSNVGLVSQEPTLFATSIFANILHGKPSATAEEVYGAARAANAHSFISSLPQGYETPVGEKGVQMSGGQKQRIAIARAILKNPKVLLLDEATSALDSESERLVQTALDGLMQGRTTIVVAHRLSTIINADLIAVMVHGQIVEMGTHEGLVAREGGAYSMLVKLQQRRTHADESAQEDLDLQSLPGKDVSWNSHNVSAHSISTKAPEVGASTKPKDGLSPEEKAKKVPFTRLLRLNKPEWMYALAGCAASAVVGFMFPGFALAFGQILGGFVPVPGQSHSAFISHLESNTNKWAAIFAAIGFGVFLACLVQQFSFGVMGQRLARRVRLLTLSAVLHQEVGWFDKEDNSSGAITSRLAADAVSVRGAVGDQLGVLFQNLVTVVAGFAIAFSHGWAMTLVITGAVPLIALAGYFQGKFMVGFSSKADQLYGTANQCAAEAFSSIRTVAAFSMQDQVAKLYAQRLQAPTVQLNKRAHVTGFGFGFSQGAMFVVYALAFWFGGWMVSHHHMNFSDMITVFFSVLLLAFGASQAQMAFPDMASAAAAVQRIFTVIDRKPLIQYDMPGKELQLMKGNIELRDIVFAYPERPKLKVFDGFCLTIDAGKTVALVGASGSGKSTIVSLVERFYDPQAGQVLIDGINARQLQLQWLRSQIALVNQEPVLFSMTIRQNIAYSRPEATEEEVREAARVANAAVFVEALAEGYETEVGEGGIQLSGGQKQRIAIARAVLPNPKILLLDEATSALDSESERVVQKALVSVMQGRTTLVVAHRLNTIRDADVIALVQSGKILEQGTHDQLLARPGSAYAGLVRLQQQAAN